MTLVTFGILRGVAKVRSIAVPRFTSTYLRPLVSAVALISQLLQDDHLAHFSKGAPPSLRQAIPFRFR